MSHCATFSRARLSDSVGFTAPRTSSGGWTPRAARSCRTTKPYSAQPTSSSGSLWSAVETFSQSASLQLGPPGHAELQSGRLRLDVEVPHGHIAHVDVLEPS